MSSDADQERHVEDEHALDTKDPQVSDDESASNVSMNGFRDDEELVAAAKLNGSNGDSNQSVEDSEDQEHSAHDTGEEEEDDSGSEDEEEDEDEDEDESEPALKYSLLGGAVSVLLHKDSASALAVSSKLIVRAKSLLFLSSFRRNLGIWNSCWHRTCGRPLRREGQIVQASFSIDTGSLFRYRW